MRRSERDLLVQLGKLIVSYMNLKLNAGLAAGLRAAQTGRIDVAKADELRCARLEGAIDALLWCLGADQAIDGDDRPPPIEMTVTNGVASETPISQSRRATAERLDDAAIRFAREAMGIRKHATPAHDGQIPTAERP